MIKNESLNVLIVDDDLDIVELIEEEFRSSGYQTLTAGSGNEAIFLLGKRKVDIVISDYKMPNGDGMKLLQFVKTLKNGPAFYFVSGQADISIEECVRAGAKEFFSKPFDIEVLKRKIESHVSALLR